MRLRNILFVFGVFSLFAGSFAASFQPIEGTFIQSWLYAPWADSTWEKEAKYLKSLGVTKIIDGDVAYLNTDDTTQWIALYDTELPDMKSISSDKDIIMEKGEKYGFKVYLGMGVDNRWWSWDLIDDDDFAHFKAAMIHSGKVAREIYDIYHTRYPETFGGFYSVYEVWNHNQFNEGDSLRDLYAERLAAGFNIVIDSLNAIDPTQPLLFSQFATDDPTSKDLVLDGVAQGFGTLRNTELFWTKFLELAHFRSQDKMLPMDAVGGGGQKIDTVEPWTEAYGNAVANSQSKIGYYANIESFAQPPFPFLYDNDYTPLYGISYNSAAPVGRFARQIATAERHVKGIFTFAFSHYHSPNNNLPGFYEVLLDYLTNQSTDTVAPKLPDTLTVVKTFAKNTALSTDGNEVDDRVFKFFWSGEADDHGVWKVNLYKGDSVYAYAVNTRKDMNVPIAEPDSMLFAFYTGRAAEYAYNPRYTGPEEYHFSIVDVWGNETFSKSFALDSVADTVKISLEMERESLYAIPDADTLRHYCTLDSSKSLGSAGILARGVPRSNRVFVKRSPAGWNLHYTATSAGIYEVKVYSPTGAQIFGKKLKMNPGANEVPLPANALGYERFYIRVEIL
ncbi:MAG: DUF4434 domain-containing protein [Fibrobacteraceae bacterium]